MFLPEKARYGTSLIGQKWTALELSETASDNDAGGSTQFMESSFPRS
jgi:hypothetical protein